MFINITSLSVKFCVSAAKPIHTGFFVNLQTSCKISLVGVNSKIISHGQYGGARYFYGLRCGERLFNQKYCKK
jgi:hypothetical protein